MKAGISWVDGFFFRIRRAYSGKRDNAIEEADMTYRAKGEVSGTCGEREV